MKKVLLVKMTSMGDLIQTLPALTDAALAIPGIKFDWVAEESFQEIPKLHPSVDRVITLASRRWKKNIRQSIQSGELGIFMQQIRNQRYDMVIDAQSNIKSAVVSLLAKGIRYGLDKKSVREYGAHFAYNKKIRIDRGQNHAVRLRQMFAAFLGYELPETVVNYGIVQDQLPILDFVLPERFVFITPIASCANKLWPESFWYEVIQDIVQSGYEVLMPWWSHEEKERVLRLQNNHPRIHLLPRLNLSQKARVLSHAVASISLDTGLAHMAAALNIPNICLYGPSSPQYSGTLGKKQIHLTANFPSCSPCLSTRCTYKGESHFHPACLETITAKEVLSSFYSLFSEGEVSNCLQIN